MDANRLIKPRPMASSKWKVGLPSKIHSLTWKVIYFRFCLWILHIWVVHFVPSSLQQHIYSNIISDREREFEIHVHFLELAFRAAPILAQIWPSMPSVKRWKICQARASHITLGRYPDPSAFCSNIGHVLAKEICFILCKHNADNGTWACKGL